MKCQVCGYEMVQTITSLPFKVSDDTIVIVKELPVYQCSGCSEYVLSDPVMQRIEEIFEAVNTETELEIVRYAA